MSGADQWYKRSGIPGHNKYDLDYSIKTFKPTFVQRFKWRADDLSEWAKTRYVKVYYGGVSLYLLKDSPDVLWDKIENITPFDG